MAELTLQLEADIPSFSFMHLSSFGQFDAERVHEQVNSMLNILRELREFHTRLLAGTVKASAVDWLLDQASLATLHVIDLVASSLTDVQFYQQVLAVNQLYRYKQSVDNERVALAPLFAKTANFSLTHLFNTTVQITVGIIAHTWYLRTANSHQIDVFNRELLESGACRSFEFYRNWAALGNVLPITVQQFNAYADACVAPFDTIKPVIQENVRQFIFTVQSDSRRTTGIIAAVLAVVVVFVIAMGMILAFKVCAWSHKPISLV